MQKSLRTFDTAKLEEIMSFIKESEGYNPDLKSLKMKLQLFAQSTIENNEGSVPVVFGLNGDYSSRMKTE